jgi:hypothetical protein
MCAFTPPVSSEGYHSPSADWQEDQSTSFGSDEMENVEEMKSGEICGVFGVECASGWQKRSYWRGMNLDRLMEPWSHGYN